MNALARIPIEIRLLLILFSTGVIVGVAAVGAAERLRFERSTATPGARKRGTILIGVLSGLAFAGLYWWEILNQGQVGALLTAPMHPDDKWALHAAYASHLLLLTWMLVASLVDMAEHTIPDLITVPGTLAGLALAAICPASLLPILAPAGKGMFLVDSLHLGSPGAFPASLGPRPQLASLALALAIYWAWCCALLPIRWRLRHGWGRAARLVAARVSRDPMTVIVLALALLGGAGIFAAWFYGGNHWIGLLTSLVGLGVGGGMIWAVRLIGGWAMGREAMGFGDVILMAMIGSYLAWQAMPIVFFLAPLFGIVIGVIQWVRYRDNVLPYGPFLCLAAAAVVVGWFPLWRAAAPYYALEGLVPIVLVLCMAMLGVLLGLLKLARSRFGG